MAARTVVVAAAGMGGYAASKMAVHELAGKDITANAVLPSSIDTSPNRKDMPHVDFSAWVQPPRSPTSSTSSPSPPCAGSAGC